MNDSHLVLVLPGSGYGPAGPVLLLPALALEQRGATVRHVTHPDWRPEGWSPEELRPFLAEVRQRMKEATATVEPVGGELPGGSGAPPPANPWRRVTVVAKSLGTIVLAAMDGDIVDGAEHRAVWLTPLFGEAHLLDGAIAKGWPSLVVGGSADRYHDPAGHDAVVAATGGRSLVIDGADHSLHVAGDVLATVEGFRRLTAAVLDFDAESA